MFEAKNKKHKKWPSSVFRFMRILFTGCIFMLPAPGICENQPKPIIVVNPGHGGHDLGARGADGTIEKNITLTLAKRIVENLKSRYQPILTRTGDYYLSITERTSIANYNKAALFVTIHAGGNYDFRTSGITISYLDNTSNLNTFSQSPSLKNKNEGYGNILWNEIHKNQITKSIELGKCIQKRFSQNRQLSKNRLLSSPLRVLTGANMPAVMIEVGYLSNPIEEKKLQNNDYLAELAKEITTGIDDFFMKAENHIPQ
ncbi:MAG: N-acetylmuramoyl-L-alanine amidase [Deltaproteobacteria bacterium]|nr:MAG: N-acetylmuramoyl-L-alanine amidase [Deltaproteobacteria bacterium]